MKYMNQKEYGKHRGISQQRVSQLIRDGYLKGALKKFGNRNLIDPEKADRFLDERLNQARQKKKNQTENISLEKQKGTIQAAAMDPKQSLAESQRLKALYDAALRKIDLDERKGKLMPVAEVEKQAFEAGRRVRDAILNIPARIGAEITSMTDVHLVTEKLTSELTTALEELSK